MPGALILLYHRVAESVHDTHSLCVTPRHFAEHMDVLRRCARPLPLAELSEALHEGRPLPSRSVVVTFDDGYADNLFNAKPLLERYEIPATVFMTTGYLENSCEFWWDELEQLSLPDNLYHSLHQRLRPLPEKERRKALDELWRGRKTQPALRETHRPLSCDELRQLAEGGLIEIGSHGVMHPVLSGFPPAIQLEEIRQSKNRLEEILGYPVESFAYPYGTRSDYTGDTVKMIQESGYRSACSNYSGLVRQGVDPYELPRIPVRDWDGKTFSRFLKEQLRG